jgi:putative AdoMet-dependent methyltransferase
MTDSFPPSDFDDWAGSYDRDVTGDRFPFDGYERLLDTVVSLAKVRPAMRVLDLGTGTGNLAERFAVSDCELWGTDFSAPMLEQARLKLPQAHFVQADLRVELPAGLPEHFDAIVSAYVFHHFELPEKVQIIQRLAKRLSPGGTIVIGDIAFPDRSVLEAVKSAAGDEWEDEFYWLADESLAALQAAGLEAGYTQVSSCAGCFKIA